MQIACSFLQNGMNSEDLTSIKSKSFLKTLLSLTVEISMNQKGCRIEDLITSALEKLFGIEGTRRALTAGGNSMMVNLTPQKYRRLYSIYPGKGEGNDDTRKRISDTVALLQSLGRAPMDIGMKHL